MTLSCNVSSSSYYRYSLKEIYSTFTNDGKRIAQALGMDPNLDKEAQQIIHNTPQFRTLTLEEREILKKIRRGKAKETIRDNRIITAYNCMYATSLCIIANNIKEKKTEYIAAAERIIEHILQHQKEDKIKLYRYISTNKNEHQSAQLLDYTFFFLAKIYIL